MVIKRSESTTFNEDFVTFHNGYICPSLLPKNEQENFDRVFYEILETVNTEWDLYEITDIRERVKGLLEYNVPIGKMTRGLGTVLAYKYFAQNLSEENVKLSYIMGWLIELFHTSSVIADDIMDNAKGRTGKTCWYQGSGVEAFIGIKDSQLLQSLAYVLLRKYFSKEEYYTEILTLLHDVSFKEGCGKSLELRIRHQKNPENFTDEQFNHISKYKTSYSSFYLPAAVAMIMAHESSPSLASEIMQLAYKMSYYFEMQQDYLSCFGSSVGVGKDIAKSSCTWLVVKALEVTDQLQRQELIQNYGKSAAESVESIKKLYRELKIPEVYQNCKEELYGSIILNIQHISPNLPKKYFTSILNKLYQRSF